MRASILAWLGQHPLLFQLVGIAIGAFAVTVGYLIVKRYVVAWIERLVKRTGTDWDDALHHNKVFVRLAYLVPALLVYYGEQLVPGIGEGLDALIQRGAVAAIIWAAALAAGGVLGAANEIYQSHPIAKTRPVKGYLQIVKLVLYILTAVAVVAVLIGQSPLLFLSGIGALTAVFMLVFKDTLLSLVASIQITNTDMIRVGDWIEMPQFGADGDVVDIALHTVKVQNWDKTITTIPTHKLIEGSFKNWRGMSESGGRRIKRSINLDISSIRFLTEQDIERYERFALLTDYIREKKGDITVANEDEASPGDVKVNRRNLTNIGTFRAYVVNYLRNHPRLHDRMTLIVRQLQPTPNGVPIEIYTFSGETEWVAYEGLQSDIFDHLLAIVPEFDLRIFQSPSSHDFAAFARARGEGGAAAASN